MVILVAETTVRLVPAVVPNLTAVAPINPVPVTVTRAPPALDPLVGEILVTVGRGAAYVNRSAVEVALVPPGVVTVTSVIPAGWAGDLTVIRVAETTVRGVVFFVVPNLTAVAPVNPVPVMVTTVLPVKGPLFGVILVTFGSTAYVNRSAVEVALVPPGVVTVTSVIPAAWAGDLTVILVAETTVRGVVFFVVPNLTAVAPVNPVPVIVTTVLPVKGPLFGEMPVIAGRAKTVIYPVFRVLLYPSLLNTCSATE